MAKNTNPDENDTVTEQLDEDVEIVDKDLGEGPTESAEPMTEAGSETESLEDIADPLETAQSDLPAEEKTEEEDKEPEPMYASPNASKAMTIMNLDSLIKRYLVDIDKLKEQLKTQRDMFEDSFRNDAAFHEESEKVKAANKVKQAARQRILKQPNVALVQDKINALREDIKDAQDVLFGYAEEYAKVAGTNQIVNDDGSILEIIHSTRLVKKSKYKP